MAAPAPGLVFDLSGRAKLRLSGADRLRYLNGQISNDLRKATESNVIHACVLSAKGKIDAEVFVAAEGEAFVLDTDLAVREALRTRLDRYIIADDVQIEDVTEAFALFHVLGVKAPALSVPVQCRKASRFGEAGTDVWLDIFARETARRELAAASLICDEECAEQLRIERGLPRWGHELTGEIIPTEANLEASTIDYGKGCYIGQEVISRIKMSGQTNKRLCGFVARGEGSVAPGMRFLTADDAQKDVGWVTSVAPKARGGERIGLGFVKRGFQESRTRLRARAEGAEGMVEIVALPFV